MKSINYKFKRGDTKIMDSFIIKDSDGNVITLGDTDQIYFTMKTDDDAETVILKKKIGDGITKNDDGYYTLKFEPAETEELDTEITYKYDIEVDLNLDEGLYVETIIGGTVTLVEDVTWKEDRT